MGALEAFIGSVGLIIVAFIQRGRRMEKAEHARVMEVLSEIKDDIHDLDADIQIVEAKLDTHIRDHAVRMFDHAHKE